MSALLAAATVAGIRHQRWSRASTGFTQGGDAISHGVLGQPLRPGAAHAAAADLQQHVARLHPGDGGSPACVHVRDLQDGVRAGDHWPPRRGRADHDRLDAKAEAAGGARERHRELARQLAARAPGREGPGGRRGGGGGAHARFDITESLAAVHWVRCWRRRRWRGPAMWTGAGAPLPPSTGFAEEAGVGGAHRCCCAAPSANQPMREI